MFQFSQQLKIYSTVNYYCFLFGCEWTHGDLPAGRHGQSGALDLLEGVIPGVRAETGVGNTWNEAQNGLFRIGYVNYQSFLRAL